MMQAFKPYKLPLRNLNWSAYVSFIGDAHDKLARYDELLQKIPDPNVLLSQLTTKEAISSTRIEGTQSTLEGILQYEANFGRSLSNLNDIKEVMNYMRALQFAIKRLNEFPLGERFFKEVHKILLKDVRSYTKILGEFRDGQVFVGKIGNTIKNASYIPPDATEIPKYIKNLEEYIHSTEKDPLVQLVIFHAQFELIHPFWDGNGRVGRILIPVFLYYKEILSIPVFYISEYFEENREEYYSKLQGISKNKDWDSWILFFLKAIIVQSGENIKKARDIYNLYHIMSKKIFNVTRSKYTLDSLNFLFSHPIFSSSLFVEKTGIPKGSAKRLLKGMIKSDVIDMYLSGKGSKPNFYIFTKLLTLIKS